MSLMSEGPDIDVQALAHLDALAALDLSAAEKAHGALMAAEPNDIPELSRAYRSLARSLRQTLALKDRLRRQRAERAESRPDPNRLARAGRFDILAEAVREAAADAGCDPAEREDLAERFHAEAWDWTERPDFLTEDLDTLIHRARTLLDLDDEDEGPDPEDDSGDDDIIEGEAREVFHPEPEQSPRHRRACPGDPDAQAPDGFAATPDAASATAGVSGWPGQARPGRAEREAGPEVASEPAPPAAHLPPEPPPQPRSGHRWDIPTHDPPAPVSPPSPDPFANWPRRIVPDHPFNSS